MKFSIVKLSLTLRLKLLELSYESLLLTVMVAPVCGLYVVFANLMDDVPSLESLRS